MQASDIMQTNVVYINKKTTIREAAKLLSKSNVSAMPVVNSDKALIGIISESDVIQRKSLFSRLEHWAMLESFLYNPNKADETDISEELHDYLGYTVEDIMTKKVFTVPPDASISAVVDLMIKNNVNHIPVLQGKKILGIIARNDILRALVEIE